ncbi:acetolactate synthase small subunit [Methylobacterium sp. E-041]|jgi:acetolactate synthase-1/3 small subunit|uniref:acetolactate synthase small subunit n=1 Tax=unclassified Methylobacterium TaxID=2615210 RepID=UPI0011C8541F|nr:MULTISPECIES: acetolactate synthase small subunit [unclassified Methylobacterium]MCJ2009064.1 acetolactate synthase small subunit [Methylobacterium sp. J-092]MCJ2039695.1 acetolactate synthase small subunit [Methylobacterium sp. J-059]MCJ2077222.1 acetolactate synthase small subunit [Methylobacterium sp. E-016]MCJ2105862.1 acetolactate synthase small subunit [Methylobacterium sp. E-041]MCJ2113864.1 acetolactate synthase small subunit [Methylobacterium sp. E-025]
MNAMNTHYPDAGRIEAVNRHTLAVIVDNEPGVLARISGMFSGRGYNIESLTVSETEEARHLSRITIVTAGTNAVIDQIKAQLDRLVPVHRVVDLTLQGSALERELCLVKVAGQGEHRGEALRLAAAFGAKTLDATLTSFVFELTGATEEIDRFIRLMTVLGLVEISRTGIAAMGRGADPM